MRSVADIGGATGWGRVRPPGHVFPETNARFRGEKLHHVHSVRFSSTELHGADAEKFDLTIEIVDDHLQDKESAA